MAKKNAGAKFSLIEPGSEPYALMRELIGAHHSNLAVAEIALVWLHGVKEDRDGHILWGPREESLGSSGPFTRMTSWKADVEAFVNAALKREQKDLFPGEAKAAIDSLRAQATVTS